LPLSLLIWLKLLLLLVLLLVLIWLLLLLWLMLPQQHRLSSFNRVRLYLIS